MGRVGNAAGAVCGCGSLGRFLDGAILLEAQQLPLDALEGVWEAAVLQLGRLGLNPLEQLGRQPLVPTLLPVCVHHLGHNLHGPRASERPKSPIGGGRGKLKEGIKHCFASKCRGLRFRICRVS